MLPSGPTAIPNGISSWPAPAAAEPNFVRYLPSGENSSTRLLPVSVTQMLPLAIAMPQGALSWPGSEPATPALQLLVQVSSSGLPSLTPQPNVITKVPVE